MENAFYFMLKTFFCSWDIFMFEIFFLKIFFLKIHEVNEVEKLVPDLFLFL